MKINTQEQFYKVRQIKKLPQLNKNDVFQVQESRQLKTSQQKKSLDFQFFTTSSYQRNVALPQSTKNLEQNKNYLQIPNRILSPKGLGEKKEELCSSFMTTISSNSLKQSKFEPNDILEIIKQKKNAKEIKQILRNEQNNFIELKQKKCEQLCQ